MLSGVILELVYSCAHRGQNMQILPKLGLLIVVSIKNIVSLYIPWSP